MTTPKMNPWVPDADQRQGRRIGKTLEEAGELVAVLGRISIQGMGSIDPSTGKTNRQRLLDETADVMAQTACNMESLFTPEEREYVNTRMFKKRGQMIEWEAHYPAPGCTVQTPIPTDVAYDPDTGQFYQDSTGKRMGYDFDMKWRESAALFPQWGAL